MSIQLMKQEKEAFLKPLCGIDFAIRLFSDEQIDNQLND